MAANHPKIDLKASLDRVRQGGIPLRAEQRLQEEAGDHRRLFTSDLTVSEFILTQHAHCEPISQVMGSCIYHVAKIPDYKGATSEITIISDGHRESRRLALQRLSQEASLVGADAVVGVHLKDRMVTMGQRGKGGDDGGEVLEFTVVGTAVKAPWITHEPGQPIITDLSGQDLWVLHQDGYEPCGFLFEFCRYHVWHVTKNFTADVGELDQASQAVEAARKIAAGRLLKQAEQHQAEYVIGSDISVRVKEVPCGFERCTLDDLDVDLSWFGTGVRRIPDAKPVPHGIPPLILSMMPLGRRDETIVEGEDDSRDVEIAAEEAEEAALEADD
ncbi:MAG: heavy metal-binding domain-containing protein [Myxococcaceae bacterium]